MAGTYDSYAKHYYHMNKDYIRERYRYYKKNYNKNYYAEHREEILQALKLKRAEKKAQTKEST